MAGDERRGLDLAPAAGAAPAAAAPAAADGESCPFTGQAAKEGEGCPFGFGGKAESASAPNASQKAVLKRNLAEAGEGAPAEPECPWPFVMLHDPVKGHAAHAAKNAKAALGAAALAVAAAVLVQAGHL